jgi:hypothetical protein
MPSRGLTGYGDVPQESEDVGVGGRSQASALVLGPLIGQEELRVILAVAGSVPNQYGPDTTDEQGQDHGRYRIAALEEEAMLKAISL